MLSSLAIRRPVAAAMLTVMVVIVGLAALIQIPQDLLPKIELPVGVVAITYRNASPEEVENMVTKPVEQALASLENLDMMQSLSMQGISLIMVQFKIDTDMAFAALDMREAIGPVSAFLPDEAGDPMVLKLDMNAMPILQVYVYGDMPLARLHQEVDDNIVTYFERSTGVASVEVMGGVQEEIAVLLNPEKLTGYGLSLSNISQLLAAENINLPSGNVSRGATEMIVRTIGQFRSVDDIRNLPILLADRSIIRLEDVASVSRDYKEMRSVTRVDGNTAIGIMVTKQSDANTVKVSDALRKVTADMQERYPELSFVVGFDQADYIRSSIMTVSQAAILGGVLAIFVVFLFLRNFKTTLIITISIPTSLLATFALMYWQNITLNLVTLCALTLAVGLLIDNSIVVLENIFRTRQRESDAMGAADKGAREIFMAVLAATITSVLVFLPIAMSTGLASLMFRDFCFTLIVALVASLVVSLTVVPMLSSKLLTHTVSTEYIRFGTKRYKYKFVSKFARFIEFLTEKYGILIAAALKRRKRVIVSCLAIFLASSVLVGLVGTEMLPTADEGSLNISVDTPYGTSLSDRDRFMAEIEEYVLSLPEVEHCTLRIGGGLNFAAIGSNASTISVTLTPQSERRRSTDDLVKDIKDRTSLMTGGDISVTASNSMGMMMGGGVDMQVLVKGPDLSRLQRIGEELIVLIADLPEVSEADLNVTEGNPEVRVSIDRTTAAFYGISAYQLANGLSTALSGTTATKLKIEGTEFDVRLSLPDTYSDSVDNMKQIMITGPMGLSVPVGQIASFEYDNSPNMITRDNQQRLIFMNISFESNDLAAASARVTSILDSYPFPDAYFYETAGMQEEMLSAFGDLFIALLVAIALVYLWLAAQFESLIQPFIIATAIPFAMSGAFLALFLTGTKLSLTSFLGLIMLVGIVINNSILLVDFIRQNKKVMERDEALIQAGKTRLRPILMTSLTTIVAMTPLAIGLGEGAEMLSPMAVAIIGGLIASTLVTLIFVPVLYSIMDDGKTRRLMKKEVKHGRIAALEAQWQEEDGQNA